MRQEMINLEKSRGWNFLGEKEVTLKLDLSDEEKLDLGERQCQAVMRMKDLQEQKKAFNDAIKDQLNELFEELKDAASILKVGKKVRTLVMPCFYDPINEQRIFVDPNSLEVVERRACESGDRQISIEMAIVNGSHS